MSIIKLNFPRIIEQHIKKNSKKEKFLRTSFGSNLIQRIQQKINEHRIPHLMMIVVSFYI